MLILLYLLHLRLHLPHLLHFLNIFLCFPLSLFLLFLLQLLSLFLSSRLLSQKTALFHSRRSGKAETSCQLSHVYLVSPENLFKKTGPKVIDVAAIGIETLTVEVVALLDKLAQLVIDSHKFIMGKLEHLGLERESLLNHIQILFVDFQQKQNHLAGCLPSPIDHTGQNLKIDRHIRHHHYLPLPPLPIHVLLKGGERDILVVRVDDRILEEDLLLGRREEHPQRRSPVVRGREDDLRTLVRLHEHASQRRTHPSTMESI